MLGVCRIDGLTVSVTIKKKVRIVVMYKSEVLGVPFKIAKASINEEEIKELDDLINRRSREGWDLVAYAFMGDAGNFGRGVLITFKKE